MLHDFNIPVNPMLRVAGKDEALGAAEQLGYPVVLKTAKAGIRHKTEHDGIKLDIRNRQELIAACDELSKRLGPEMLLSSMIRQGGIEMVLGMVRDAQFGALVMLGFGGRHLEVFRDVAWALAPFDAGTAKRLVSSLQFRALLEGRRGQDASDVDALCHTAAMFSVMVAELAEVLDEIDINPVIVTANGVVAVDALVIAYNPGVTTPGHLE